MGKILNLPVTLIGLLRVFQVICTFFLSQTMQVFSVDNIIMDEWERTSKQTFGINFKFPPEVGKVIIWKLTGNCEPLKSLQYNGKDIRFTSEETYLLLTQKIKGKFMIYYWLGKTTPLIDKVVAAKYAVMLTRLIKLVDIYTILWVSTAREIEGMESDSLQNTMKIFTRQVGLHTPPQDMLVDYLDKDLPTPYPNLYVLLGDENYRVKKIPISLGLQWLMNKEACVVLEVEYKVKSVLPMKYVCGSASNEKQIKKSWILANYFFEYSMVRWAEYDHSINNEKHSNNFKRILELLEDNRFYNHNERDDSGDHLKSAAEFVIHRDEEISLFKITNNGLEENRTRPLVSSIFDEDSIGYLLDTKSVAGIFAVLAEPEHIDMAIKGVELAEEYLDKMYPVSLGLIMKMRIIYINLVGLSIDFATNLSENFSPTPDFSDDEVE